MFIFPVVPDLYHRRGVSMAVAAQAEAAASKPAFGNPGYLGFWATTLWALAAVAAYEIVLDAGIFAERWWISSGQELSPEQLSKLAPTNVALLYAIWIASIASGILILVFAIRRSPLGIRKYLGLSWPGWRVLLPGIYLVALLMFGFVAATSLLDDRQAQQYAIELYRRALANGRLSELIVDLVVIGPFLEELLFRGFVLPGWAASPLGSRGAIILSSIAWALLHTQYNALGDAYVFCSGTLLGWIRLRSGSVVATMILHAIGNATSLVIITVFYA
jgi:uncharacterized protein